MLLVIIGVLFVIIFNKYYKVKPFLLAPLLIIGVLLIPFGLFVPLSGYKTPVMDNQQALLPVGPMLLQDDSTPQTYLVIKVFEEDQKYTYCINKDGYYDIISKNKTEAEVVVQEIDFPVVEKYVAKAKSSFLTYGFTPVHTVYIIKVSQDMIRYDYSY